MKSAKKAASAKPTGAKKRKPRKSKAKTKSAGKIGFKSEALESADANDGKAHVQVASLIEDIQRIFMDAVAIHEKAPDAVVEIPTKDILRLAGVTLALGHQCHEYGQNDQSKVIEGAWSIVAALVQKQGGDCVVTGDDLEAASGFQLKRDIVDENSALKLSLVEREEPETETDEKPEAATAESDESTEEKNDE